MLKPWKEAMLLHLVQVRHQTSWRREVLLTDRFNFYFITSMALIIGNLVTSNYSGEFSDEIICLFFCKNYYFS